MTAASLVTKTAFVLMPFGEDFADIYEQFIKITLEDAGFSVKRADDLLTHQNILKDVVEMIMSANLIVADLTDGNPNVFYELGLAHALRRSVILLTQEPDRLPFDLKAYRVIGYDTHFTRIERARRQLRELAIAFREDQLRLGTPVSDYLPEGVPPSTNSPPLESHRHGVVADSAAISADERGFLDYQAEVEEGFERLRLIVEGVTGTTAAMGEAAHEFAPRITSLASSRKPGAAAESRIILREFADRIAANAKALEQANGDYSSLWARLGPDLESMIATTPKAADPADVDRFTEVVVGVQEQAQDARKSYLELAKTIKDLPRIERRFNQAMSAALMQVTAFAENLDQTIASLERVRNVAAASSRTLAPEGLSQQLAP